MTVVAPPVEPEAPGLPPAHGDAGIAAAACRGLAAFGIVTAVGVAIGMAEYAATNGAYRPWTWIKVGFLYLLSFCGVGLHVDSSGPSTFGLGETHLQLRLPMLVCTALVVWLLFRAGRSCGERAARIGLGARARSAAVLTVALAFAVPTFLVSLPATLRFPNVAGTVSPERWESAILPLGLALSAAAAGSWRGRRSTERGAGRAIAMIEGGWHMFLLAVALAFVAFLVLAAVKPDGTGDYARFVRDSGRVGEVTVAHHVLLLPDQSIWLLGPAMGGSTQVVVFGAESFPGTVKMSGVDEGALALFLDPTGEVGKGHVVLGGGFYLFLLVPLVATVLGGRRAASRAAGSAERVLRGLGAGAVFGVLMATAALFSAASLPLPLLGQFDVLPVSIHAAMPSTALLALAWGAAGGALGALSSGWWRSPAGRPPQGLENPLPAEPD
jgi:hypothetical protein